MLPRFNDPQLLPGDKLLITGPYGARGEVMGDVTVHFVLVKDAATDPILGETTVANLTSVPASGAGLSSPVPVTTGDFSATVAVPSAWSLAAGNKIRAIGLAVAVIRPDAGTNDPPAYDTFTWCVTVEVQ